jgi:hypothetical protein
VDGVYISPLKAFRFKIENAENRMWSVDGFDQSRVIGDTEVSLEPYNGY